MRMRIRGRPIESDTAHVKSFCSFVARIFVAQSMEEAFATGNGYAEYGSNVVKMSSSETKHVLILGLGASLIHASKGNRHMSILKKLLCTWAGIADSYYKIKRRDQLLRKRVGLSVVPARDGLGVGLRTDVWRFDSTRYLGGLTCQTPVTSAVTNSAG